MRLLRSLATVCFWVAVAAPLHAHGGVYRGPQPTSAPPGQIPGVPPLPGTPVGPATPNTGVRGGGAGDTSWEVWWEFNKDPFLWGEPLVGPGLVASGSDDFFMGIGRVKAWDVLEPSERDRRERIRPALVAQLDRERNRDIVTACLVALAKTGAADGVDLLDTYLGFLTRNDQEIRETAVLAMGIHGDPRAIDPLVALWNDTADGRRLMGRAVDDRSRAFAGYALGLLGRRNEDLAIKERVHTELARVLGDPREDDRDVWTAAVSGLGILDPLSAPDARGRRLLWQVTADLWAFYERDLGKAEQVMQAHVPIAIARLVGRGDGPEQRRCKDVARRELVDRSRHNAIHQSAAIVLGMLALPEEQLEVEAACAKALVDYYEKGNNQAARFFSLISLGRIGGAANRERLLALHVHANKATERPWASLALGLVGWDYRKAREGSAGVDGAICERLMVDLREIDNKSTQAATALALGLCGFQPAAPRILELLETNKTYPIMRGYLCVALALMDDIGSIEAIRSLLADSLRQPVVVQQAAIALGRLGDHQAADDLARLLGKHDSVAALSAIAGALGFIGDRRSIDPLVGMLADDEITKLGRAFVAAALGGIGDKDVMPWNACLSVDASYHAAVTTLLDGRSGILDIL